MYHKHVLEYKDLTSNKEEAFKFCSICNEVPTSILGIGGNGLTNPIWKNSSLEAGILLDGSLIIKKELKINGKTTLIVDVIEKATCLLT